MAKKLNTKVILIILVLFGIMGGAAVPLGFKYLQMRNPEYCMDKAQAALEAGDYETAERFFGRAVGVTKEDAEKIDRYFDLAEFHLIQNSEHEPNWRKALGCWSKVLSIDPKQQTALQKLLDYFLAGADLGNSQMWKPVQEYSEKLLEVVDENSEEYDQVLRTFARSNLEIARLGSTTYRQEPMNRAVQDFQRLLEKYPSDGDLYFYLAQAALIQGNIDEASGLPTARQIADEKALDYLTRGTEKGENPAAAWARLYRFRLQNDDPNKIDDLRHEIEDKIPALPPDAEMHIVLAASYERAGNLDRREEIDRALAAMRQAVQLEPEIVEYQLQLASILYRKGSIYRQPQCTEEAVAIARAALELPDAKDIPGPRQSYGTQNRYRLYSFLAHANIDKALEARSAGKNDSEIEPWLREVRLYSDRMAQIQGTSETVEGQKWQGLIALAEGKADRGLRVLYKAYEQAKATDRPNERSQVDSYLCYVLARQMSADGLIGLRQEFLSTALFNQNSIAVEKPQAILELCRVLIETQSYPVVLRLIDEYENVYGPSTESRRIRLQVNIRSGSFDEAREMLDQMPPAAADTLQDRYGLLQRQLVSLRGLLSGEKDPAKVEERRARIAALNEELLETVAQLLKTDPARLNEEEFVGICRWQIAEGTVESVRSFVKTYLAALPEATGVLLLQRELQEPAPAEVTQEQRLAYLQEILQNLADPETRDLSLGDYFRSIGQPENALSHFRKAYERNQQSEKIVRGYFELLLQQKEYETARTVLQQARSLNIDGCEGGLMTAQLAIAQEDYPSALRRLEECLNQRPLLPQAHVLQSRIHLQQANFTEAVSAITKAVRMNPTEPTTLLQWASILNERNRQLGTKVTPEQKQEALASIRLARAFNPRNLELQSLYAELISETTPLEGLAIRQSLFEIQPTPLYGVMLGNMALRVSRQTDNDAGRQALIDMAGDAYQKAYDLDRNNEQAKNALAEYKRLIGRNDEAVEILGSSTDSLWKFYVRDGQYEKAAGVLEQLRRENPDDQEVLRGLVLVSQGLGSRDKMQEYLGLLLAKARTANEELWVLQQYLDAGLAEVIKDKLSSFAERYPGEPSILLLEAWYEMGTGKLETALQLTNRFLETNTQHGGAWRLRGRIHRLLGQYREAVDALRRSKEISPQPDVQMELANVYLENNQVDAAVGELRDGMSRPQAPLQIRLMLEETLARKQRTAELRDFYQQTLAKYPENVFWLTRTGRFALDQKDYPLARTVLQKAWEQSRQDGPGDVQALDLYLESLYQSEQYENLLTVASELVDTPFAPIVYAQLGQTQVKLGNRQQATENFRKALDRAGTNEALLDGILTNMIPQVGQEPIVQWANEKIARDQASGPGLFVLTRLAVQDGRYNQAMGYLAQSMQSLSPEDPAWFRSVSRKAEILSLAYTKTSDAGYLDELLSTLELILEKQPNNVTVMNNLAYLLLDTNRQTDRALEYAREASRSVPDNATFQDTYALALYRSGRYAEAMQALQRSLQLSQAGGETVSWEVYKHHGMILEKLEQSTEALNAYRKALEHPGTPETEKEILQQSIQKLSEPLTAQSNTGV